MALAQAMTTSFKESLLKGIHSFESASQTYKIALYSGAATLSAGTRSYTATDGEIVASGYTTGGNTLTIAKTPTASGTTAFLDFEDTTWGPSLTFNANAALIYRSGNQSVAVLDFSGTKVVSNGTLIVSFPTADGSAAILRIA